MHESETIRKHGFAKLEKYNPFFQYASNVDNNENILNLKKAFIAMLMLCVKHNKKVIKMDNQLNC